MISNLYYLNSEKQKKLHNEECFHDEIVDDYLVNNDAVMLTKIFNICELDTQSTILLTCLIARELIRKGIALYRA